VRLHAILRRPARRCHLAGQIHDTLQLQPTTCNRSTSYPEALAYPSNPHPICNQIHTQAELAAKIAELVEAKTIEGVADVRDESDRTGESCGRN